MEARAGNLGPSAMPGVRTVWLWFPYLVMKLVGDSFVSVFNVKVHESLFEHPSVYQ